MTYSKGICSFCPPGPPSGTGISGLRWCEVNFFFRHLRLSCSIMSKGLSVLWLNVSHISFKTAPCLRIPEQGPVCQVLPRVTPAGHVCGGAVSVLLYQLDDTTSSSFSSFICSSFIVLDFCATESK